MNPGDTFTLTIEKLVYQGWGLGFYEGKAIFVSRGLPGDVLEVELLSKKRRHFHAKLLKIVTPSEWRGTAACGHFPACGGCQLLDVPYDKQLDLKQLMLADCIQQLYPELPVKPAPVLGSTKSQYYRNKMEFAVAKTEEGQVYTGLKARGKFDEVIPTSNCLLQSETSNAIRGYLEEVFTEQGLDAWDLHEHQGLLRYVVIRQSKTFDNYMVILVVSQKSEALFKEIAEGLRDTFPEVVSVYLGVNASPSDTAFTTAPILLAGEPVIKERFKDLLTFTISPQSFFQTNTTQAKVLYQKILELGQFKASDLVLDLYCGTGTIGLYLAPEVKQVIGIEEVSQSIEDAKKNAERNDITNISFIKDRVKNALKFSELKPDVVVLDPPRSGTVPKALNRIIALNAPKVVYVSCNPTTLLRDLKSFVDAGYQLEIFQPVDMFPNTYHVEIIVVMTR